MPVFAQPVDYYLVCVVWVQQCFKDEPECHTIVFTTQAAVDQASVTNAGAVGDCVLKKERFRFSFEVIRKIFNVANSDSKGLSAVIIFVKDMGVQELHRRRGQEQGVTATTFR